MQHVSLDSQALEAVGFCENVETVQGLHKHVYVCLAEQVDPANLENLWRNVEAVLLNLE
jgi:hypothetical protein